MTECLSDRPPRITTRIELDSLSGLETEVLECYTDERFGTFKGRIVHDTASGGA